MARDNISPTGRPLKPGDVKPRAARAASNEDVSVTALPRRLAGLIGPTLLAISTTEAANIRFFSAQTAPVVYLNGTLLFVAGLAIVRAYGRWGWNWTVLVTLSGWAALSAGLYRMAFPGSAQAGGTFPTFLGLAALFGVGAILTLAAYMPNRRPAGPEG